MIVWTLHLLPGDHTLQGSRADQRVPPVQRTLFGRTLREPVFTRAAAVPVALGGWLACQGSSWLEACRVLQVGVSESQGSVEAGLEVADEAGDGVSA